MTNDDTGRPTAPPAAVFRPPQLTALTDPTNVHMVPVKSDRPYKERHSRVAEVDGRTCDETEECGYDITTGQHYVRLVMNDGTIRLYHGPCFFKEFGTRAGRPRRAAS